MDNQLFCICGNNLEYEKCAACLQMEIDEQKEIEEQKETELKNADNQPIVTSPGSRIDFESICNDFFVAITHIEKHFVKTFNDILFRPGPTLTACLNHDQKQYPKASYYFFVNTSLYLFLVKSIMNPLNLYVGIIGQLSIFYLIILLFGIAFIGWRFSGSGRYNYWEVLTIFAYIYGSIVLINLVINIIESKAGILPFLQRQGVSHILCVIITDLPTAFFIFYWLWDFFRVNNIPKRKYFYTATCSFLFYLLIVAQEIHNSSD
jgi:hypothetical protein